MFDIVGGADKSLQMAQDALGRMAALTFGGGLAASDVDLKRTEDCRFSPSGRIMAVAGFSTGTIVLFKVEHRRAGGALELTVSGKLTLTHPSLALPHGLDFVDETHLAVANRDRAFNVYRIPDVPFDGRTVPAEMLLDSRKARIRWALKSPGSVAIGRRNRFGYEAFLCINYSRCIGRQIIAITPWGHRVVGRRIALEEGMQIPDGITICKDTGALAISNHDEHAIRVYPDFRKLRRDAQPAARLTGVAYPHGLRFVQGGRGIVAADAGAPLVHYWQRSDGGWEGDRTPTASFRVMDDETFQAGRDNPQEGGPKGLDLHPSGDYLFVTSECQGVAAFDLPALLGTAPA